jgi:hypothetical protein
MTDTTHTPGPWTVSQPSGNYIDTATGSVAALTYGATKADAHLIAAAPDLLAALETALEMLIDSWGDEQIAAGDDQVANVIKDAITKAKGN